MTSMLTWQGADGRALEATRLALPASGLRAVGRMVRAVPDEPTFTASYRIYTDEDGLLQRLSVTSVAADRERDLTVNRTEDGDWLLDTGAGGSRAQFDGVLDIDLAFSPMFNTLPIRRLELHQRAGDHELGVVFVSLPELSVELATQRYRTKSLPSQSSDGNAVVSFSRGDFAAELVIDELGLVVEYPGLARRI